MLFISVHSRFGILENPATKAAKYDTLVQYEKKTKMVMWR